MKLKSYLSICVPAFLWCHADNSVMAAFILLEMKALSSGMSKLAIVFTCSHVLVLFYISAQKTPLSTKSDFESVVYSLNFDAVQYLFLLFSTFFLFCLSHYLLSHLSMLAFAFCLDY